MRFALSTNWNSDRLSDGAALADEIKRRWPALAGRIVLITGDALGPDPDEDRPLGRPPRHRLGLPAVGGEERRASAGRRDDVPARRPAVERHDDAGRVELHLDLDGPVPGRSRELRAVLHSRCP